MPPGLTRRTKRVHPRGKIHTSRDGSRKIDTLETLCILPLFPVAFFACYPPARLQTQRCSSQIKELHKSLKCSEHQSRPPRSTPHTRAKNADSSADFTTVARTNKRLLGRLQPVSSGKSVQAGSRCGCFPPAHSLSHFPDHTSQPFTSGPLTHTKHFPRRSLPLFIAVAMRPTFEMTRETSGGRWGQRLLRSDSPLRFPNCFA